MMALFAFTVSLLVLTPPQLAQRLEVEVIRQYIVTTNFAYANEEECRNAVGQLLQYTEQQHPMFQFRAEVECFQSPVPVAAV